MFNRSIKVHLDCTGMFLIPFMITKVQFNNYFAIRIKKFYIQQQKELFIFMNTILFFSGILFHLMI